MPAIAGPARAQHGAAGTVVVALAVAGIATAVGTYLLRYGLGDLTVNRDAVRSWLSGDGLYAYRSPDTNLGSAISPVAAFLLAPAALLPVRLSGWLLGLAGVAALGLALIALAGPVARRYGKRRWPAVLVAMAAALPLQPIRAAIGLGDLDLLVFGLVIADVVALRR